MENKSNINENHSYFYSLRLEGINCFRDYQSLKLCDDNGKHYPWTIILGDNGTGKTTLLRILDRMQPSLLKESNLNYYPLIWTYSNFFKENKEQIIEIQLDLEKIEDRKFYKLDTVSNEMMGNTTTNGNNKFPFLLSYGASRRINKTPKLSKSEHENLNLTTLLDENLNLINVEEWLLQKYTISLISEKKTKNKFEKEYNLVKNLLINFLPDVNDIRVKLVNEKNSELLVEVETYLGWVNLRDLSFGYQTITALLVDIASKMMEKYPESENSLAEPVVILIDEIDLHLHPKWQRTMIEMLSKHFPKAQFIATAHSPLIVQSAQDNNANIVVCRKEGDKVVIDNNPIEVKGWRIDQILTSDLFETDSSRSVETQKNIDNYIALKGKKELSNSEKLEYDNLIPKMKTAFSETLLDEKLLKFSEKYLK